MKNTKSKYNKMRKTERVFKIVKMLLKERNKTMADLSSLLGVSVRTIQRDMEEVSLIIPIYYRRGRHGGGVYVASDELLLCSA